MKRMASSETVWRKASRSTVQNDSCVEVADGSKVVGIRDSKDPSGPLIIISHSAFRHFTNILKNL